MSKLYLDLVICIKKNKTEIYCNPLNYDSIMFYAACWNNLTVHCLDQLQVTNLTHWWVATIVMCLNEVLNQESNDHRYIFSLYIVKCLMNLRKYR